MQKCLLEPALVANVRFTDFIVCKNKSFVWKGHGQKKINVFLHALFLANEIETRKQKLGGYVWMTKKIWPYKSFRLATNLPLQLKAFVQKRHTSLF